MSTDEKKPLGRILLTRKLVSQETLEHALEEQRRTGHGKPLASFLADKGIVREEDALRALSEQYGVPGIELSQVAILLEHLGIVPRELAESQLILPVLVRGERLFVATANPSEKRVLDELEFVTGKKVYAYVALSDPLVRTITAAYDARAAGEKYYLGPRVPRETLVRLGLAQPGPPPLPQRPVAGAAAGDEDPPARASDSPPVIVDEAMRKVAMSAQLSTMEFSPTGSPDESGAQKSAAPGPSSSSELAGPPTMTRDAKTILVVDDEEEIRKMLRRVLQERGYRVIEADRGLLALKMVKDHMPDLLVLDAMLPELHGFDIARRIRGSEKYGSIPIVMISAVYRGWRIAQDLKDNYGITDYLEKPFRLADVTAAVERALAQREAHRSVHPPRDPEALSAEAERLLDEGVKAYRAGRLEDAIAALKRGVSIDPLAHRLHFQLGLLYGKKGALYEGISELERAIELNPKHFGGLKNLAVLYEKAGFRHKAVEMWERCLHVAPDAETRTQVKEHLMSLL